MERVASMEGWDIDNELVEKYLALTQRELNALKTLRLAIKARVDALELMEATDEVNRVMAEKTEFIETWKRFNPSSAGGMTGSGHT